MAQKITPFLWFNNNAEEATDFYVSVFKNSEIYGVNRMGDGKVLTTHFRVQDQDFVALNGGPVYEFTEAVSFVIDCASQEEVDELWEKLTADGGEPGRCGWLKDKYGLSWQVIPSVMIEMLQDQNPERAQRVMQAMMEMDKIDISKLEKARDQT